MNNVVRTAKAASCSGTAGVWWRLGTYLVIASRPLHHRTPSRLPLTISVTSLRVTTWRHG